MSVAVSRGCVSMVAHGRIAPFTGFAPLLQHDCSTDAARLAGLRRALAERVIEEVRRLAGTAVREVGVDLHRGRQRLMAEPPLDRGEGCPFVGQQRCHRVPEIVDPEALLPELGSLDDPGEAPTPKVAGAKRRALLAQEDESVAMGDRSDGLSPVRRIKCRSAADLLEVFDRRGRRRGRDLLAVDSVPKPRLRVRRQVETPPGVQRQADWAEFRER